MSVKRQMRYFYFLVAIIILVANYGIKAGFFKPSGSNKENQTVEQLNHSTVFFDEAGRPHTLDDFKGRYVLVNLWATWCPPCVVELPALDTLQTRLKEKNFAVVAIAMDRTDVTAIISFLEKKNIDHLDVYWDKERQVGLQWKYDGLPISFLIDPNGNVVKKYEGAVEWDKPPVFTDIDGIVD